MRVLLITTRVDRNHPILGHIQSVVTKLAGKVDSLDVVAFGEGMYTSPENVRIYRTGRGVRIKKYLIANYHLAKLAPKCDAILTYMYPGELPLLAAPYSKLWGKPLVMYRNHGHIDKKARISHRLANRILTASPEGCRINSNKVKVIGHHIDTDEFKPKGNERKNIVSAGRIDRAKRQDKILEAMNVLINKYGIDTKIDFVGKVLDENYYNKLKKYVKKYNLEDNVNFIGHVDHVDMPRILNDYRVFVDASTTGSLDTVVLEAMACGTPVVTNSEAFYGIFDSEMKAKCYYKNLYELSDEIKNFLVKDEKDLQKKLREEVVKNHSLDGHTTEIVNVLKEERK